MKDRNGRVTFAERRLNLDPHVGDPLLAGQNAATAVERQGIELAQVAFDLDSETITTIVAAVLGVGAGLGVPIFFVMQVSNWPSNCKLDCHDTSAFPCPEFAPATGPSVLLHTYSHLFYAQQTGRARQRAS